MWAPELLLFVAVSGDNTNTPGKGIQTSPDGVNWTEQDTPASMDAETFNHIFLADLKSG